MRIRLLDCLHPVFCPAGCEGRLGVEEAAIGEIRYIELGNGERWALKARTRYLETGPSSLDKFIKSRFGEAQSTPSSGMRRIRP